jgi:hypothetical protein
MTIEFRHRPHLHNASISIQVSLRANTDTMQTVLRKLLWTGLYAGLSAGATMVARRAASGVWRVATGEEPPAKK